MTTVNIQSGTTTYYANAADTTYVMAADAAIQTSGRGIDVAGTAKNRILEIDGKIHSDNAAIHIESQPAPFGATTVHIGKSAVLDSNFSGVYADGQGHHIVNAGTITSGVSGMTLYGTNSVLNSGSIAGEAYGINLGTGTGEGMTVIRNTGTISGANNSVLGSAEYETVINAGKLEGDVDLMGGDDFFIFKKGEVDGVVRGGAGDDTFIVRKAGLQIAEEFGEGADSVYASVSFQLSSNIETLYLTGKKDIDAIGGSGGNEIHGNTGRNEIDGAGGMDFIDGGKGNDILTGGSSSDEFHFARGTGRDVVTDFEAGLDEIQLGDLKGAKDYADMLENHLRQKGDDLWITYGDDVIVLKDTVTADLKAGDFDFG